MKRWQIVPAAFVSGMVMVLLCPPTVTRAQEGGLENLPFLPKQDPYPWLQRVDNLTKRFKDSDKLGQPKLRGPSTILNEPEPNSDILVTRELGEWMILICSYSNHTPTIGSQYDRANAPEDKQKDLWARQMVALLRDRNEPYRLPAYVFNYGRKELIEEERRIQEYVRKQKEKYNNLRRQLDNPALMEKIRIPIRRIPLKQEAGVLVGGYKDMPTARRALAAIRKLKAPDEKRVRLDRVFEMTPKSKRWVPVNPFKRAFVVRNPTWPKQNQQHKKLDIAALRSLNTGEPFNLLNCNKPFTLAIKEYRLPTSIVGRGQEYKRTIQPVGLAAFGTPQDIAKKNANSLADALRKMKSRYPIYVLHTEYSSVVTVGGFDRPDGQEIRHVQQMLTSLANNPNYASLKLFRSPTPMRVPR